MSDGTDASKRKYMPDAVSVPAIGLGACAVLAGVVIAIIAAFPIIHAGRMPPVEVRVAAIPGTPSPVSERAPLEPQPARTIAAFDAEKRRLLTEYAWVDRGRGIVRIPIEQAMDWQVQHAGKSR